METVYENIINMTNNQAANVLKNMLKSYNAVRGSGKSTMICINSAALIKAIALLESTPDEKEE